VPRRALRLFLGRIAEMLRIRFYNRRFASRAPAAKTPSPETPAERRGLNPPAFNFEILSEPGDQPSLGKDAGPPRGHPASSGSVLDGTSPASGRAAPRRAFARCWGSGGAFSAAFTLCRSSPSDTSPANDEERLNALHPSPARFPARHVNAARFREPEAPSAVEVRIAPLRALLRSSAPAGRRAQVLHAFIAVRDLD